MNSKFNFLFFLSIVLLFLGLIWMFLPHAVHDELIEEAGHESEDSHFTHTLQGAVVAALGAALLIVEERRKK